MTSALLLVALASANSGPVYWTTTAPIGGIGPTEPVPVRLVSEDLTIAVQPDGRHFLARAVYQLHADALATVRVATPIVRARVWSEADTAYVPDPSPVPADAVSLVLAGRPVPCVVGPADSDTAGAPTDPAESARLKDLFGYRGSDDFDWTWCAADLPIAAGPSTLELRQQGDLLYTDTGFEFDDRVLHQPRTLYWPLFPAARWQGPVERLTATVDPGPFRAPADAAPIVTAGGLLRWDLASPDLAALDALRVVFDDPVLLHQRQLARWNRDARLSLHPTARASSAASGTPATAAVDGTAATAWCPAKTDPQPWIEVTFTDGRTGDCTFDEVELLAGHTGSREAFRDHGRAAAFSFERCGGGGQARAATVPDSATHDHEHAVVTVPAVHRMMEPGHAVVHPEEMGLAQGGRICVRIRATAVRPGLVHDGACLGEIVPVLGCEPSSFPPRDGGR